MKLRTFFLYLSHRAGAMSQLILALCFMLAIRNLIICARVGFAIWPAVLSILLLGILEAAVWFLIVRPYRRTEHLVNLFIDGYSLSSLGEDYRSYLTPANERLMKKMEQDYNSARMLVLSKRQAQYQALQNQINPHFLYNTLESIRSEVLIAGLDEVADMTEALARFFRYTISKVENLVSVEEELMNCETYFHIQQYRFGSRLQFTIECAPEDKDDIYCCRLPKLTLQPILENSIIHGTEEKIGSGDLRVRLERTGKLLLITVSDDGVGMDDAALSALNERLVRSNRDLPGVGGETAGGVALVNVHNRIHLLFGEEYGLHVYSLPGVGTDVQITLPMVASDRELKNSELLQ